MCASQNVRVGNSSVMLAISKIIEEGKKTCDETAISQRHIIVVCRVGETVMFFLSALRKSGQGRARAEHEAGKEPSCHSYLIMRKNG